MKAKALSIALLVILIAPVSITYSWLRVQKHALKREIKWRMIDGMGKEDLVKLSFTPTEAEQHLRWEHSREFEYRGEMYDVVETHTEGDTVHYWCWWDNEETQLNRHLQKLVSIAMGLDPESEEKQAQLSNFLKLNYYPTSFEWTPAITFKNKDQPIGFIEHIISRTTSPPSPPPDLG